MLRKPLFPGYKPTAEEELRSLRIEMDGLKERHDQLHKRVCRMSDNLCSMIGRLRTYQVDIYDRLGSVERSLFPDLSRELRALQKIVGWGGRDTDKLDRRF